MEDEGYTSPPEETGHSNNNEIPNYADIPWDEVANWPVSRNRFLSWETLKAPFPYRSSDFLPNQIEDRLKKFYCSEDVSTAAKLVDQIWKLPPTSGRGDDGTDADFQNSKPSLINQLKSLGLKPKYIPLKHFIQHCIHLLAGRETVSFSHVQKENSKLRFVKNPHVLVHGISPTALLKFSQPLLRFGSLYKNLSDKVNSAEAETLDNSKSSMLKTLLKFVWNYLKIQQTFLMLKAPSLSTLTKLLHFIKPFLHQLEVLNDILESQECGDGSDLLAQLNQLMFTQETPFIADLVRNLFLTCSSVYIKQVSDWIFRGDLSPSSEILVERRSLKSFEDRRYFTKQFIQRETIPIFLEQSAVYIFETGRALNLLNTIHNTNSSSYRNSFFCYDTEVLLEPVLSFDEICKLKTNWEIKLSCFLEEHSHLTSAVLNTIEEVVTSSTCKLSQIDLKIAEDAKSEQKLQADERARDIVELKQENQRLLSQYLQNQMKEAKESKTKLKAEDEIEDRKNQEYNKRKYFERSEERRLLAEKYNYSDNPGNQVLMTNGDSLIALNGVHKENEISNCNQSQPEISTVRPSSPHFIMHESNSGENHDLDASDSIDYSKSNGDQNIEYHSDDSEMVEKFNPDNLIVRDPVPYKLDLPSEINNPPINWSTSTKTNKNPISNIGKLNSDPHVINYFIAESIAIPLRVQNTMVNQALLHCIVVENQLYQHVSALNSFLCLQNGLFGRYLNDLLISEVNNMELNSKDDLAARCGRLNNILNEALKISMETEETNPFVKNLTFTLARDHEKILEELGPKNSKAFSKFQLLNLLRLNYSVEWPLNIILTDEMLSMFEKLFGFVMQISRAERLLERVFCLLKCKSSGSTQLRRLHNIRYDFFHFVRSVRNYVSVTVIHCAWSDLCDSLPNLDSLEKIYEHLVSHVKSIIQDCLLGAKGEGLIKLLLRKLRIIESFCSRVDTLCSKYNIDWSKGDEIPADEFQELCNKFTAAEEFGNLFISTAFKLTKKGIYPKVAFFFEQYNFNEFYQP